MFYKIVCKANAKNNGYALMNGIAYYWWIFLMLRKVIFRMGEVIRGLFYKMPYF